MSIDIVIVNWNSGNLLSDCIESIIEFGKSSTSKVVVVDNDSSDGSINFLHDLKDLPDLQLIKANENLGFGRACNLGAKHCNSNYILFLNPDTRIYQDSLNIALDYMSDEANLKVGICGIQLENENGDIAKSNSRFPSLKGIFCHSIGLSKFIPVFGDPMNEWDHSYTREVDQVIGAFFFVRRILFKELSGFDERFFVYFEEVDFSFRAKNLGWNSIYLTNAQAFHVGGGVSQQVISKRLFYSLRSRILYTFKHFSLLKIILILFTTVFIEPVTRIVFAIIKRSSKSIKETSIAYYMFYKWLVLLIFKR